VIILDTLLLGGIKFVLGKIAAAVDAELSDDTALKEELLEAQMRLEMGEMSEEEFTRIEREILDAIRVVRERMRDAEDETGELRITGIEATTWSDESEDEADPADGRDR
jgi:hypothetical protein